MGCLVQMIDVVQTSQDLMKGVLFTRQKWFLSIFIFYGRARENTELLIPDNVKKHSATNFLNSLVINLSIAITDCMVLLLCLKTKSLI